MASCVLGNRWYVFGGLGCGPTNALWALDVERNRWEHVNTFGLAPPARSSATLVGSEGELFLFGGLGRVFSGCDRQREGKPGTTLRVRLLGNRETFSDVWVFEVATRSWRVISEAQMSPVPRRGHTSTLVVGKRLRSADDEDYRAKGNDEIESIDTATSAALRTGCHFGRESYTRTDEVCPDRNDSSCRYMVVIGGAGPDGKGFEVTLGSPQWAFDLETQRWKQLKTTGCVEEASERFGHTATLARGCIWVVGGLALDASCPLYDVVSLELDTLVWARLDIEGSSLPLGVYGHSACCLDGSELIVLGGHCQTRLRHSNSKVRPNVRAVSSRRHLGQQYNLVLRALDLRAPRPSWRTLPWHGDPPLSTYGHACFAWQASQMLEFDASRQARTQRSQKHGVEGLTKKKNDVNNLGAPDAAIVHHDSCVVVFGGSIVKQNHDLPNLFVSADLYVFDRRWTPPESNQDSDTAGHDKRMSSSRTFNSYCSSSCSSIMQSLESSHDVLNTDDATCADFLFFLEQLDANNGSLPSSYKTMKNILYAKHRVRQGKLIPLSHVAPPVTVSGPILDRQLRDVCRWRPKTTAFAARTGRVPGHHVTQTSASAQSHAEMLEAGKLAFDKMPRGTTIWEARKLFNQRLSPGHPRDASCPSPTTSHVKMSLGLRPIL